MFRRVAAPVALFALLIALPAHAALPRFAPSVAACALGTSGPDLRGFYETQLARAERRFGAHLTRSRAKARRIFAAGVAAYVYGLAPVAVRGAPAPTNQLLSIAALANPSVRAVVLPNNDTAYTVGRLQLAGGPMVLDLPDTAGRYYVVQLLDAYSNTIANVGRRTTGTRTGSFAITPPGYRRELPPGVRRIESPTSSVWILGRTLVEGASDLPAVAPLLRGYRITALADWTTGTRQSPTVLPTFPPVPPTPVPRGLDFFQALAEVVQSNPPPPRDACALRAFGRVGLGSGPVPGTGRPGLARRSLVAAERAGRRLVRLAEERANRYSARRSNGWLIPGGYVGDYGRNYLGRAVIAVGALGANVRRETIYPLATTDSRRRMLDGGNSYRIRFSRGRLPPARAFWSITMYGADRYLVENEIDRYSIGDRTPGLRRARDGSLTILVQHRRPTGAAGANWLPAPSGRFRLAMRLYEPRPSALTGDWQPPPVVRHSARHSRVIRNPRAKRLDFQALSSRRTGG